MPLASNIHCSGFHIDKGSGLVPEAAQQQHDDTRSIPEGWSHDQFAKTPTFTSHAGHSTNSNSLHTQSASSLFQLRLNNLLIIAPSTPDLHDLQPTPMQQTLPLPLRPLHRPTKHHHQKIQRAAPNRHIRVRQHIFIKQQSRVPGLHGPYGIRQYPLARSIVPVVQHAAQVVGSSAMDWLRGEEVVRHWLNTLGRPTSVDFFDHGR